MKRQANAERQTEGTQVTLDKLKGIETQNQVKIIEAHIQNPVQKEAPDVELEIAAVDESLNACQLCDLKLSESDIRVSKRVANYAKDSGGDRYRKLVQRVNQGIMVKRQQLKEVEEQSFDDSLLLEDLPMVCFRCLYQLILNFEGRQRALRFFNVAQNELQSNYPKTGFGTGKKVRVRKFKMHELSDQMKEVGILKGTFYDYNQQAFTNEYEAAQESKRYESRNTDNGEYHTLYYSKKAKKNKSFIVSITREGAQSTDRSAQKLEFLDQSCESRQHTDKKIRHWREDFADRFSRQYGDTITPAEKKLAIKRCLDRERMKYMTGYRMMMENHEIMLENRKRQHHARTVMSRKLPQIQDEKERSRNLQAEEVIIVDQNDHPYVAKSQSGECIQDKQQRQKANRDFTTTHTQYFTKEVYEKARPLDRTFYRKISSLGAYANASFNAGVYINPPSQAI